MKEDAISIRPFIGAKNFGQSRSFYQDLGFIETVLSPSLSVFSWGTLSFYLQNAYVKDWVDNTMVFFEVKSVKAIWDKLVVMELNKKYPEVKLVPIRVEHWGSECFLHDPSGILLHFGEFS